MKVHSSKSTAGFTIVELMIATLIFSIILLVITTAVMRFSGQYYRGVVATSTQGTARSIIEEIVRSTEYTGGSYYGLAGGKGYCVGSSKRFSYELFRKIDDANPHGLVADSYNCNHAGVPTVPVASLNSTQFKDLEDERELLGKNMRLLKLDILENGGIYTITVRVASGDDIDLTVNASGDVYADSTCRVGTSYNFCAVSELTTTVKKRISGS